MGNKLRIKIKKPYIAFPGSIVQNTYAEPLEHGFLLWDVESRDNFTVKFNELTNVKPYVTVEWKGTLAATLNEASKHKNNSRFRIKHRSHLSQRDITTLIENLTRSGASEVTFKNEQKASVDVINAGAVQLVREDLRNVDVLVKLMREYYCDADVSDAEWAVMQQIVSGYVAGLEETSLGRNTTWSLRKMKFDNLYGYGDNNTIDFDKLEGIVGIFGPNRAGKSSIPGTLMYSLFNSSDRGSIKNLHICNVRKQGCSARVFMSVNGVDYVVERSTTKIEDKHGKVSAPTALNLYMVDSGGEIVDLAGEQRIDTEKELRKLVGSAEDFTMLQFAAQGEMNQYIKNGQTKRLQVLSKVLDLDVLHRLHDAAKQDVNFYKNTLKQLPDKDWSLEIDRSRISIGGCDEEMDRLDTELNATQDRIGCINSELLLHNECSPVTHVQVDNQRLLVQQLINKSSGVRSRVDSNADEIDNVTKKLDAIIGLKDEHDVVELKKQQNAYRELRSNVELLKNKHDNASLTLKRQQRSLKTLASVPCGDAYPNCRFIRDAHVDKDKIAQQEIMVSETLGTLTLAVESLEKIDGKIIDEHIVKLEKLNERYVDLTVRLSDLRVEKGTLERELLDVAAELTKARVRLQELEHALQNAENVEVITLRNELDGLQRHAVSLNNKKMASATRKGKLESDLDNLIRESESRSKALHKLKIYELIHHAFSKKGIPSIIISSQLPLINSEIAKILNGVVDFVVELEYQEDDDQLEIYINYGDCKRIIDLCSGMEKVVSSLALRAALINVSMLPKSDVFILDEIDALDDVNIEACGRLLKSLKTYFKTIVLITHLDGLKDVVDNVLDITRNEKDSKVVFE